MRSVGTLFGPAMAYVYFYYKYFESISFEKLTCPRLVVHVVV